MKANETAKHLMQLTGTKAERNWAVATDKLKYDDDNDDDNNNDDEYDSDDEYDTSRNITTINITITVIINNQQISTINIYISVIITVGSRRRH